MLGMVTSPFIHPLIHSLTNTLLGGGDGVPSLDSAFSYLIDDNGYYLVDNNYLFGDTTRGDEGFTPTRISNLAIWLDAQDLSTVTLNSNTVSSWKNKGTLGVGNATQATALRQPLYVASGLNGLPVIQGRHDGTNASQMEIADSAGLDYTEFTSFIVAQRVTDLVASETITSKQTPDSNTKVEHRVEFVASGSARVVISPDGNTTPAFPQTSNIFGVGIPVVIEASFTPNLTTIKANNGPTASSSAAASVYNDVGVYTLFSRRSTFNAPYAGFIGEVLFYTRNLTAFEKSIVTDYLYRKWGM